MQVEPVSYDYKGREFQIVKKDGMYFGEAYYFSTDREFPRSEIVTKPCKSIALCKAAIRKVVNK